jgi:hypothetical protein
MKNKASFHIITIGTYKFLKRKKKMPSLPPHSRRSGDTVVKIFDTWNFESESE